MEVNAVNENGFTALDIIEHTPRDMKGMEIRECLVKAGALSSRNKPAVMEEGGITMVIENPQLPPPLPPSTIVLTEAKAERPPAPRDGAGMKITSNENKKDWMKKKRDSLMIAATLITGMTFQMAVNPPGGVWDEDKLTSAGAGTGTKMLLAGTSIMAYHHPEYYELFTAYNSMSFFGSLSMVFPVVSG